MALHKYLADYENYYNFQAAIKATKQTAVKPAATNVLHRLTIVKL